MFWNRQIGIPCGISINIAFTTIFAITIWTIFSFINEVFAVLYINKHILAIYNTTNELGCVIQILSRFFTTLKCFQIVIDVLQIIACAILLHISKHINLAISRHVYLCNSWNRSTCSTGSTGNLIICVFSRNRLNFSLISRKRRFCCITSLSFVCVIVILKFCCCCSDCG